MKTVNGEGIQKRIGRETETIGTKKQMSRETKRERLHNKGRDKEVITKQIKTLRGEKEEKTEELYLKKGRSPGSLVSNELYRRTTATCRRS
jgi:hypothetical protein